MALITIKFRRCIQGSSEVFGGDECVLSIVDFELLVNDEPRGNFAAQVKLSTDPRTGTERVEVGAPIGYEGPFHQEMFSRVVEAYYLMHAKRLKRAPEMKGIASAHINVRIRKGEASGIFEVAFDSSGPIEDAK